MRLPREFYECNTLTVARNLIGQRLVRISPVGITAGIITETEGYLGQLDDAAYAYKLRIATVSVLYSEKGHAFVHTVQGGKNHLNISTGKANAPECVLIRAIVPDTGIEIMKGRTGIEDHRKLCHLPENLAVSLGIDMRINGADLVLGDTLYIESGIKLPVTEWTRFNVEHAKNCKDKLWRFKGACNLHISGDETGNFDYENRINYK